MPGAEGQGDASPAVLADSEVAEVGGEQGEVKPEDAGEADDGAGAAGAAADSGEAEGHDEELREARKKLSPELQKVFDKAIGRKVGKLRAAEERALKVETERDELRKERDDLKGKVTDEAVLEAANRAGVLPEYVSADDARLVAQAEREKAQVRNLRKLVLRGEEYTGRDAQGRERTWTRAELADELEAAEERLEKVSGRAERIKAKVVEDLRADLEAGRKARTGENGRTVGRSGGVAGENGRTVGRSDGHSTGSGQVGRSGGGLKPAPPALPGDGGTRRPPGADAGPSVDWSKVENPESMKEALLREERAKSRRKG